MALGGWELETDLLSHEFFFFSDALFTDTKEEFTQMTFRHSSTGQKPSPIDNLDMVTLS